MSMTQITLGEMTGGRGLSEIVDLSSYSENNPYIKTLNFTPQAIILYTRTSNTLFAMYYDIVESKVYQSRDSEMEADVTSTWLNTYVSASGNTFTYNVPWNTVTRIIYI